MDRKKGYKTYLTSPTVNRRDIPRQTLCSRKKIDELPNHQPKNAPEFADEPIGEEDIDEMYNEAQASSPSSSECEFEENSETDLEGDKPIYVNAKIQGSESALLIYSFILRHKISKVATEDLLRLINLHMPIGTSTVSSQYLISKKLKFDYTAVDTHLYCTKCENYLGLELTCKRCTSTFERNTLLQHGSFFISFDSEALLKQVLNNETAAINLKRNLLRRNIRNTNIENIYDGTQYKLLSLKENDITCLLNTDGVPVFKSSKFSLWPILYSINELNYELSRKYTIPLGLWFGTSKPNFNTFLEPFVKVVSTLACAGVNWSYQNEIINSKVYFPMLVADSVARPLVQGILQFNGSYGCTWCLCPGKSVQLTKKNSHKWIYPPVDKSDLILRDKDQFINHIKEFNRLLSSNPKLKSHYGIRGASKLLLFPKFDIVHGFVFDYMHTALLGISKTFTNLWLDSVNHSHEYYIGKKSALIDAKYLACLVPLSISRSARSISERRFWKASEWRTWSYVIGTVLESILPKIYLNHFLKFVNALMILCSDNITPVNLNYSEVLLFSFVKDTESLYGESMCSYNVHLLLHAADCVRNWGPLYRFSAFASETYNGILLGYFQGSQKVPIQISSHVLELLQISNMQKLFHNMNARNFFNNMLNPAHKRAKNVVSTDNVVLIESSSAYYLLDSEKTNIIKLGLNCSNQCSTFKSIYVCTKLYNIYSRTTTRRCNSVVSTKIGSYYLIRDIVLVNNNAVRFIASKLNCQLKDGEVNTLIVNDICSSRKIIRANEIFPAKFIVINNENREISTIVRLPNIFELE